MTALTHPFGDPAYLFNTGENDQAYKYLGAHWNPDSGAVFRVWAPHARSISVVGDFNQWKGEVNPAVRLGEGGIWEVRVSEARPGQCYKFQIESLEGERFLKADPFARQAELRPNTASVISPPSAFEWEDWDYLKQRPLSRANNYPLNIYEVHAASWRQHPDGRFYNYRELAQSLASYCADMGYNYVELLPVMEHPLDASWGYQVTGFFAPTARYGTPDDFRYFVNHLHSKGIGVILDWVPAHFPKDAFGLRAFDGTPLYEAADTRMAEQPEWGTMLFDWAKSEVRSFLISSAVYWIQEFHVDGLRVDAVSTLLYRNYGSSSFVPNCDGGREHYEGVSFLRTLNHHLQERFPQVLLIAEEATTWPLLTHKISKGGMGFDYKWDMGWMHDTLDYMSLDYIYRKYHHHSITFSMSYGFSERFLLPLSHDEVVHGKRSLIGRMPGDYWRQFACLRTLFAYMIGHPGGKLLFMGGEFAQFIEWRFYEELEWFLLGYDAHRQMQDWVRFLNHLYLQTPACWQLDTNWEGFQWLQADDAENSVYAFYRKDLEGNLLVFVLNETPAVVPAYCLPLPRSGRYRLLGNSDDPQWGGSGYPIRQTRRAVRKQISVKTLEGPVFVAEAIPTDTTSHSMTIDLPPLSALIFSCPQPRPRRQNNQKTDHTES